LADAALNTPGLRDAVTIRCRYAGCGCLCRGFPMSVTHDRKFLDLFNLMVGFFVGLLVGIILLAGYLASRG